MNRHIILLDLFLHLKCTLVESRTDIDENCFLGERRNLKLFLGGKKEFEVSEEKDSS